MSKALILGGTGFLGSHLNKILEKEYTTLAVGSKDIDLLNLYETNVLFKNFQPDVVFHLAAFVGGIGLNKAKPGDMFYKNMQIGINVVEAFRIYFNKNPNSKLVMVGTVCSYPKYTPTPFKESSLWDGYPEETNAPYGVAKRALIVMCEAYKAQFGTNIVFAIPSNLYGPDDNFDEESSHVIPALISKIDLAKKLNQESVELWGTGTPTREFLYAEDCAKMLEFVSRVSNNVNPINLSVNSDISIKKLAEEIKEVIGYEGNIIWDASKPDGQPVRKVSNEQLLKLGYKEPTIPLKEGLKRTYGWYRSNKPDARA